MFTARAITIEDIGYKIGHPYPTVDPTGRFVYVSVFAPPWRAQLHNTAGIAKFNLETGVATIVPFVGRQHGRRRNSRADDDFTPKRARRINAFPVGTERQIGGPD